MIRVTKGLTGVTKRCSKCKLKRDTSLFNFHPGKKDKLDSWCRPCKAKGSKEYYWKDPEKHRTTARNKTKTEEHKQYIVYRKTKHPEALLLCWAKQRSKKFNVPFNLRKEDITIPTHCPVLGIKLKPGKRGNATAPSLDRIKPQLGYVANNVVVMSRRANLLKNNANLSELKAICSWLEKQAEKDNK